jgi:hypothetical protein
MPVAADQSREHWFIFSPLCSQEHSGFSFFTAASDQRSALSPSQRAKVSASSLQYNNYQCGNQPF